MSQEVEDRLEKLREEWIKALKDLGPCEGKDASVFTVYRWLMDNVESEHDE